MIVSWNITFEEVNQDNLTEKNLLKWREDHHHKEVGTIVFVKYNENNPVDDKTYRMVLNGESLETEASKLNETHCDIIKITDSVYDTDNLEAGIEFISMLKNKIKKQ